MANKNRPIVDKDVKGLVAGAIATLAKVYGLSEAQAADRVRREAERVGFDIANAVVLAEMKGTGLGAKPANDAKPAPKPGVVKTTGKPTARRKRA